MIKKSIFFTPVKEPEIIEAGRLTLCNIFKGTDGKFYSSQVNKPELGYNEIIRSDNLWNFTFQSKPKAIFSAEIIKVNNENFESINELYMCKCSIGGFIIKAVADSIRQNSYIDPKGALIETIAMLPSGLQRFNHENSKIHMVEDDEISLKQNNKETKTQNLENERNNLKLVTKGPLVEIGKILETDFYEDKKKNLYYKDFSTSSKLNDDNINKFYIKDRDFWVIKDGYTVNLSIVNWMDYQKMREGQHNEAELPNLYVTLSTPTQVFELVFNIDGQLIPPKEKSKNYEKRQLETEDDSKYEDIPKNEIKSLNVTINNKTYNVNLFPDCELQNLTEEDILNIHELVSSYFKKNTGFFKKSVTGYEILMLWAQSRDPRILNIKIQNKEKFITLGLGSLLSQIGFSCDATLMLTQDFKRK
tara:strand:- start:2657 stop:3910 length:1254 start_codon:yes stop_codon:yes gene_type:complete